MEHEICGYHRAIRSVTGQLGPAVEARDDILLSPFHAVRGHDKISVEHLARRELDTRSTRDGRILLHVAHGGAKADTYAMGRAFEAVEYRVIVRAVDLVVQRAM